MFLSVDGPPVTEYNPEVHAVQPYTSSQAPVEKPRKLSNSENIRKMLPFKASFIQYN
jgi:hypothetical protein